MLGSSVLNQHVRAKLPINTFQVDLPTKVNTFKKLFVKSSHKWDVVSWLYPSLCVEVNQRNCYLKAKQNCKHWTSEDWCGNWEHWNVYYSKIENKKSKQDGHKFTFLSFDHFNLFISRTKYKTATSLLKLYHVNRLETFS